MDDVPVPTNLTARQLSHGLVNKWTDMIPLRLILGLFEAGFFPGCLYLISTWYTRYELHQRYSLFYLVGCVVTGFGGILAYGLMQMVRSDKNRRIFMALATCYLSCTLSCLLMGTKTNENYPIRTALAIIRVGVGFSSWKA